MLNFEIAVLPERFLTFPNFAARQTFNHSTGDPRKRDLFALFWTSTACTLLRRSPPPHLHRPTPRSSSHVTEPIRFPCQGMLFLHLRGPLGDLRPPRISFAPCTRPIGLSPLCPIVARFPRAFYSRSSVRVLAFATQPSGMSDVPVDWPFSSAVYVRKDSSRLPFSPE